MSGPVGLANASLGEAATLVARGEAVGVAASMAAAFATTLLLPARGETPGERTLPARLARASSRALSPFMPARGFAMGTTAGLVAGGTPLLPAVLAGVVCGVWAHYVIAR